MELANLTSEEVYDEPSKIFYLFILAKYFDCRLWGFSLCNRSGIRNTNRRDPCDRNSGVNAHSGSHAYNDGHTHDRRTNLGTNP